MTNEEDSDLKNTLMEIAKTYPELVKQVYTDAASNPVKEIGILATDLLKGVRLIFAPVQYMAHYQDKLTVHLMKMTNAIPEENRISPPSSLLLPILEKLKYQDDDELLTRLYIELLTRACDKERMNEAHPAFINVIPQLSPDEAKIVYHFSSQDTNTGRYFIALNKGASNKVLSHLPFINVDQPTSIKKGYTLRSSAIIGNLFPLESLTNIEHIDLYLSHLKSLNLVEVQKSPGTVSFHRTGGDVETGRLHKKDLINYKLTMFGELFAVACIPDEFEYPMKTPIEH